MYAISFELEYEPHEGAYDEVRKELEALGFDWAQGSVYINRSVENSLTTVYKAISALSKIGWFKSSVRDIRAFKVEDWSDFTEIVKTA